MSIKDGGPAFPVAAADSPRTGPHPGMSLRDYFAAAALTGMHGWFGNTPIVNEVAASWAYEIADAMIAERDK